MTTSKPMTTPTARERRMLDRYELIAEIAKGGMGTVMLARLEGAGGFQRFFAIKLMHPHLAEDRQFVHMLLDEARLAARIHHPNVVATVDVCESKVGYYLVMDWVEGFTLAQIVDHPKLEAADRVRIANRILLDAMAGLDAAHNLAGDDGTPLGIVHRDVSPQNVLVGLDGVGRITDFGVALAASRITSSRPGIIKGKPAYMAPEQARGEALDRRADVFALGVMLWEAMLGRRLFLADSDAGTVYRVIHAPIQKPSEVWPEIPAGVEAACLHALERDPAARTPSARAMAAELIKAAEPTGLIASSHEVAEKLAALFADEIRERRASIREHLSTLGTTPAPMVASDVFDVPKLRRTPTDPVSSEEALAATKAAKTPGAGLATTLRERPQSRPDGRSPIPLTRSGEIPGVVDGPSTPAVSATHAPDEAPPSVAVVSAPTDKIRRATVPPPRKLGSRTIALWALCTAIAVVATIWIVATVASPDPAPLPHRPDVPAAAEAVRPVTPTTTPSASAPTGPAAPAPTSPATPPATPAAEPATEPAASTATEPRPTTPTKTTRPVNPRPTKTNPLEVEANPYR